MDINKPNVLYHGSQTRNIKTLKLYESKILNNEKVIFAGDLWFAIAFCRNFNNRQIQIGLVNENPYIREGYYGALEEVYSGGGWLYTLPAKSFNHDGRLPLYEYISRVEVQPIKIEYIQRPLDILSNKLNVKY